VFGLEGRDLRGRGQPQLGQEVVAREELVTETLSRQNT
jgi:hypothetical protein